MSEVEQPGPDTIEGLRQRLENVHKALDAARAEIDRLRAGLEESKIAEGNIVTNDRGITVAHIDCRKHNARIDAILKGDGSGNTDRVTDSEV